MTLNDHKNAQISDRALLVVRTYLYLVRIIRVRTPDRTKTLPKIHITIKLLTILDQRTVGDGADIPDDQGLTYNLT